MAALMIGTLLRAYYVLYIYGLLTGQQAWPDPWRKGPRAHGGPPGLLRPGPILATPICFIKCPSPYTLRPCGLSNGEARSQALDLRPGASPHRLCRVPSPWSKLTPLAWPFVTLDGWFRQVWPKVLVVYLQQVANDSYALDDLDLNISSKNDWKF